MEKPGILLGRSEDKITLRICALEPYSSEITSEQVGIIADIAEKYGSGVAHITPRQTVEIPDVGTSKVDEIEDILSKVGLYLGSTDKYLRNVISCSRWCLYNAIPVSDLTQKLNKQFHNRILPGKTNISLSGCDFSCVRSRTSDIGVIARVEIELTDKECKYCNLCIKEPLGCQVDAITLTDEGVLIDTERCVRCGFCTNVCKPETIAVKNRGYDIYIGGSGGMKSREAEFLKTLNTDEEIVEEIERLLDKYSDIAEDGERIKDVINRLGINALEV